MSIDTSALRKFQDVWGPVLQTIPAVLDAAEREADLDRAINAKRIELERLKKEIAEKLVAAENRVKSMNADAAVALERKQAIAREVAEARAASAQQAAADAAQRAEELAAAKALAADVQSQIANLQADYAAKRDAAEAEHQSAVKGLQAEIKAFEARRAAAEKSLNALRERLG